MVKISTSDQLLLLAYGELETEQARLLQDKISRDKALAAEWHRTLRQTGKLSGIQFSPSQTSLRIVMEHSSHTEHLQEI